MFLLSSEIAQNPYLTKNITTDETSQDITSFAILTSLALITR